MCIDVRAIERRALASLPKPGDTPLKWIRRVTAKLQILTGDNSKLLKALDLIADEYGDRWIEHVDGIDVALALAPANVSGVIDVCAGASPGCRDACIYEAGNGRYPNVKAARIERTKLFAHDRGEFAERIAHDVVLVATLARALGVPANLRPNMLSDLPWERIRLFSDGSTLLDLCRAWGVRMYDYTKIAARARQQPYPLTYSRSELTPDSLVAEMVAAGINVAVPFATVPESYLGLPVIDGDKTDRRLSDPPGVIVGLKVKLPGAKDQTGFIVRSHPSLRMAA